MTDSTPEGTQKLPPAARPHLLRAGSFLGPYEIVSPLAEGGMGQIYRAHDPRLGREVALKVVAPALAGDADSLRRFEREARAVAALNHPNVLVIHDIGVGADPPYLVTELLDGESLRQALDRGPVPLPRALDLAAQTLAGLAGAHEKGIVHRDLKPANLFVTPEGRVKILDFGIARPLYRAFDGAASEAETMTELTQHGRLLGTVGYMSPEQARGEPAGPRADLFAFGCVLYEMVTGRRAFQRATAVETLSAILKEEPAPARSLNRDVDPELDRILARCLEKRPEDRFQSAREVMTALEAVTRASGTPLAATTARARHRRSSLLAPVGVAALVVSVAATMLWRRAGREPVLPSPDTWEQVTFFPDSAVSPALSPDGRLLAFLRGPSTFFGPAEVYVKLLPDGEPVALTSDGQRRMDPVFSPEGNRIAYTQRDAAGAWDTWVVPVLGGAPRPWLLNASGLTWIAPGEILFSEIDHGIHMGLVTAPESRADPRPIYFPPHARGMAHRSSRSPDGRWLLAAEMETGEWLPCRLLPFDGRDAGRPVGPDGQCTGAAWSPDGSWMYFASNAGGQFQLWRQRFPGGEPAPITAGPLEVEGVAITPDGRFAVTSVGARQSTLFVMDDGRERPIGSEGFTFLDANSHFGFSRPFSPDGSRLFYQKRREASRSTPGGGEFTGELWSVDLGSGALEPVLPGVEVTGYDQHPAGDQVVAGAVADGGRPEVWLVPLDRRRAPRRLELGEAYSPWFGPGGEVYVRRREEGVDADFVSVWSSETDRIERVLEVPVQELVAVSPDGAWLIVVLPVEEGKAFGQLAALPRRGGEPRPVCANCYLGWAPGGRYVYIFLYATDHRGVEDARTVLIALPADQSLPTFPAGGVERHEELLNLPGVVWTKDGRVYPGPRPNLVAYTRESAQRNLFRIPLPR